MICPRCRTENAASNQFCKECGFKLHAEISKKSRRPDDTLSGDDFLDSIFADDDQYTVIIDENQSDRGIVSNKAIQVSSSEGSGDLTASMFDTGAFDLDKLLDADNNHKAADALKLHMEGKDFETASISEVRSDPYDKTIIAGKPGVRARAASSGQIKPVEKKNFNKKASDSNPRSGAQNNHSAIQKPSGEIHAPQATGKKYDVSLKMAAVLAIIMCACGMALRQGVIDDEDDVIGFFSVAAMAAYVAVLVLCGLAIRDSVFASRKVGKEAYLDLNLWLAAALGICTVANYSLVHVSYILMQLATGDSSVWNMLDSLYSLYQEVEHVKEPLIVTAVCGGVICFLKFGDIIPDTTLSKVRDSAVSAGTQIRADFNEAREEHRQNKQQAPRTLSGDSGNTDMSYIEHLRELKLLLDEGVLTQEEFEQKKKTILKL